MSSYGGCGSCEGRCCREYVVPVSGQDLWSLSRSTGAGPWSFVVLMPSDEAPEPPGEREVAASVRLVADGPMLTMVLDKKRDGSGRPPCVFLVELSSGRGRCGVYESRPAVCQVFPFAFRHGSVAVRPDVVCAAGSWNVAAVDLPRQRAGLLRYELDWAVHRVVAAAWNERVDRGWSDGSPQLFSPADLFAYWLEAYDRVAEVTASYPVADFERLVLTWGRAEPSGEAPAWSTLLQRVAGQLTGPAGPLPG